jgi:hypothetical protein
MIQNSVEQFKGRFHPEFFVILLLFVLASIPLLNRSLWHDELVTVQMFSQLPSMLNTASEYPYPNNHRFHSLLVRFCLWFGNSEALIRLPALLGGLLLLSSFYYWTTNYYPRFEAAIYTILLSTSLPVFAYSHHARGYSLLMAMSAAYFSRNSEYGTTR